MPERNEKIKVLFYTSHPFLFRSTLIGDFYEIAQIYPTVLLSEKLDLETEKIVKNKKLFPKLQEIIPVRQYTEQNMNLLARNKYFYNLAKNIIRQYKPDIVITSNDRYPFELYLLRFAKKINAVNIALRAGFHIEEMKNLVLWSNIMNVYFKFPDFLPFRLRLLLVKFKKQLGYFIYYWIMPLLVGQMPFAGSSSFILCKKEAKPRDADYYIVFSKREYNLCIKDGVPAEKLYILAHFLERESPRRFLKGVYYPGSLKKQKTDKKILTLMLPYEQAGFRKDDYSLISKKEMQKNRIKILTFINQILRDWRIFIKPHPEIEIQEFEEAKKTFESISNLIIVTQPQEPADRYIEMSDIIVGIPPSSTTIFTALLGCPEKIILLVNLQKEFLGDNYRDFEGVEYIDTEEKLIKTLESIRDNRYQKRNNNHRQKFEDEEKSAEPKEFSSSIEAVKYLFQYHRQENYRYEKTR